MDLLPIAIALVVVCVILVIVLLVMVLGLKRKLSDSQNSPESQLAYQRMENWLQNAEKDMERMQNQLVHTQETVDIRLETIRNIVDDKLSTSIKTQQESLTNQQKDMSERLRESNERLAEIRTTLDSQLKGFRAENTTQLDKMREVVDEKLQATLNERITKSFELVNKQLSEVGRGLGEMQSLASDVGGLKKVLSNVKTRGIVGEVQLAAILKDILAPSQYEENVETVPGSGRRVEFAVKLPGEDGETTWLPIDSKFPADTYEKLRDAQDSGDGALIDSAWKELETRLKGEAKDIHEKYVDPPHTTAFGILFLPFEGLYAEVVDRPGLLERLQRDYRVNIAGPSTMAALLNSIQMGFQTVAIQKRADEIQKVLSAVKAQFGKYHEVLLKARNQLNTAGKTVDELLGTRTNQMNKALKDIVEMDSLAESDAVLGIKSSAEDLDD